MKLFNRDLDRDIAIVAEIGVNHEGSEDAAKQLVELAAGAGADAVKFQTYTPERFVSANDPDRLDRVRRFALDEAAHRGLAKHAAKTGISFFSTAVTEDVVPLLNELCPAIKIASGDLTFEPTIRAAARTGKPMIVSTGLGSITEIDRTVAWVGDEIGDHELRDRLVLMHCVSAYPVPIEEANVLSVPYLAERYPVTVGYSNHVIGAEACHAAVALGAKLIEVHFTDQKSDRTFRDHALSFEPAELQELVGALRKISASLGTSGKVIQKCEGSALAATRKGVVAARDLSSGTVLAQEDLMYARPALEFAADEAESLIGRKVTLALRTGELIPRNGIG